MERRKESLQEGKKYYIILLIIAILILPFIFSIQISKEIWIEKIKGKIKLQF